MMPWAKDPPPAPPKIERMALFSSCKRYRYVLRRGFVGVYKPLRLCVWMNPSVADDKEDDPSIRVGMSFARRWGDGGILVVNVFSLVHTDSTTLPERRSDCIGVAHWQVMRDVLAGKYGPVHPDVFCGWGDAGAGMHADEMKHELRSNGFRTCAIALTKHKNPGHPLRKKLDLPLVEF